MAENGGPEKYKNPMLSRRGWLKLAGAGATVAGAKFLLPQAAQDDSPFIDYARCAEALAPLIQGPQNLFLADTNHANPAIYGTVARPEIMAAFEQAGIKHLCLEIPAYLQPLADALHDGAAALKEPSGIAPLLDRYKHDFAALDRKRENRNGGAANFTASVILQALAHGIRVHFVDSGLGVTPDADNAFIPGNVLVDPVDPVQGEFGGWYHRYTELTVALAKDYYQATGRTRAPGDLALKYGYTDVALKDSPAIVQYLEAHKSRYGELLALRRKYGDWLKARVDIGNRVTAQMIAERTHGEKFAVLHGGAHMMGRYGLPALLSEFGPSTTVELYPDKQAADTLYAAMGTPGAQFFEMLDFTRPADYQLFLNEGKAVPPDAATVKLAQETSRTTSYNRNDDEPVRPVVRNTGPKPWADKVAPASALPDRAR